jgi:hypothetical protein
VAPAGPIGPARRALRQRSIAHPVLRGLPDLDGLLERRRDDHAASAILRALAVLAPGDDLAARTLLQALLPGLVRLAGIAGYDDPAAIEELVSPAWERIHTYPAGRRWPPTCCSTCASATAPIASSTHPDRPTPRQ